MFPRSRRRSRPRRKVPRMTACWWDEPSFLRPLRSYFATTFDPQLNSDSVSNDNLVWSLVITKQANLNPAESLRRCGRSAANRRNVCVTIFMLFEKILSSLRGVEFDRGTSHRYECLARVPGYHINRLVRPRISNSEALRCPGLDDHDGYATISCLNVHFC